MEKMDKNIRIMQQVQVKMGVGVAMVMEMVNLKNLEDLVIGAKMDHTVLMVWMEKMVRMVLHRVICI